MYEAGARAVEFAAQARKAHAERDEVDRQTRIDTIIAKKDCKIQNLVQQIRTLQDENIRLDAEQRESHTIIVELRDLIDGFQSRLEEVKQGVSISDKLEAAQRETDRYRKETAILTRALAVSSVEAQTDSEAAVNQAQYLVELDQLREENNNLRVIESEVMASRIKVKDADDLRHAIAKERIEASLWMEKADALETLTVSLSGERDRWRSRCEELESAVGKLRSEQRLSRDHSQERISDILHANSQLKEEIAALEIRETKQRDRVSDLEQYLIKKEAIENSLKSEIECLRTCVTDLDNEIRSLAISLATEAEANQNLAARLERIEAERERLGRDLVIARRREEDLRRDYEELIKCKSENEALKKSNYLLQTNLAEKESKILGLEHSKHVIRESLSLEIGRLTDEVSHMASTSASLSDRYHQLEREKDKIKSQLAGETISRLGRLYCR